MCNYLKIMLLLALPAFASAEKEIEDYIPAESTLLIEIHSLGDLISSTDDMLMELGLLSVLGINSIQSELFQEEDYQLDFIDFDKPVYMDARGSGAAEVSAPTAAPTGRKTWPTWASAGARWVTNWCWG